MDKVVDGRDVYGVRKYSGGPSRFDLNLDAVTDDADLDIVRSNLPRKKPPVLKKRERSR